MDGFKNSTKTQYSMGGYAKGGSKFGKVMGEFKAGTLHSGSKKGAEVTNPKQAVAIALSEARKAGMKKSHGGMASGGTMTAAEKRMVAIQKNETGRASKPATSKPATTSGNKPMTDAEKRMVDIEKNETGGYKKGGSAQRKPSAKTADALRAQKYKAAMASRPNREPRIPVKDPAKVQMAAGAIKSAIEKAISTRAAQQPAPQAAPMMEAAAPPMMGAPAMKKGGKFMKKAEGGTVDYVGPDTNKPDRSAPKVTVGSIKKYLDDGSNLAKKSIDAENTERQARVVDAMRGDLARKGSKSGYAWAFDHDEKTGRLIVPSRRKLYRDADRAADAAVSANTSDFKTRDPRTRKDIYFDGATFPSRGMREVPHYTTEKAKGGMTDIKQDKALVKKAVHKHEAAMHPGKPMTKLRKGGMPC